MSTTIPTFLLPDSIPPHTASPPSKLASRYRPTPLPSPNHSSYGPDEPDQPQARPSSPPPPPPPHPEQPHPPAGGPPKPSPDPRPSTPSPPSKDSSASPVPLLIETTFIDSSLTTPPEQPHHSRTDSFFSTSSSFSSGGSPLQTLVDQTPSSTVVEDSFAFDQDQDQLQRPTVTRAKRSYSNHMVEVALAALEGLMLEQRRGTSPEEEVGEKEIEEKRARGMGGEGVKSVWREVRLCE